MVANPLEFKRPAACRHCNSSHRVRQRLPDRRLYFPIIEVTGVRDMADDKIDTRAPSSPTLVAQAEAVFESYLAARVVNARRELAAAKNALLSDNRSRDKLEAVRRAETNLEKLQSQLLDQKRNAARARARTEHEPATPTTDASHLPSQFGGEEGQPLSPTPRRTLK